MAKVRFIKPKQEIVESDKPDKPDISPPLSPIGDESQETAGGVSKADRGGERKARGQVIPLDITPKLPNLDESEDASMQATGDAPKRKRGRPKKSEKQAIDREKIAGQIFGAHLLLDTVFPGSAIKYESAQTLADSVCECMEAYGVSFDPKTMALFNLIATAVIVEAPVASNIIKQVNERRKATMIKKAAAQPEKVNGIAVGKPETARQGPPQNEDSIFKHTGKIAVGEAMKA
ncbi:MAG: hypothetical protein IRZ03_18910 [Acidobacterium ailaaui]|nr:hypothetical protein [Pseudacidobacterium ailaaui]